MNEDYNKGYSDGREDGYTDGYDDATHEFEQELDEHEERIGYLEGENAALRDKLRDLGYEVVDD